MASTFSGGEIYLRDNPDVLAWAQEQARAQGVNTGPDFRAALNQLAQQHYSGFGQDEGRTWGPAMTATPAPDVAPDAAPDVARTVWTPASVPTDTSAAPDMPDWFNSEWYLNQNPDVAGNDYFGDKAWEHYYKFGLNEGRKPYGAPASVPTDTSIDYSGGTPGSSGPTAPNNASTYAPALRDMREMLWPHANSSYDYLNQMGYQGVSTYGSDGQGEADFGLSRRYTVPTLLDYTAEGAGVGVRTLRDGGEVRGPGTGTSDSIPARLSDGEFVMTNDAVAGAGNGSRRDGAKRLYKMMKNFEARSRR
jgi:hypothetical protein